jgi:hypothetical protein
MYEIHAKGRDPLLFLDAYKAGEAFYSVRREDLPKAVRYDAINGGDRLPINAAMTVPAPAGQHGHEHLFLDADPKFRAGYEAARNLQPAKAVTVQDMQPQATSPQPSEKGQTVNDEKTIYRLEAKGQAPQSFTDAAAAGKAFYNSPSDGMAKVMRLDPSNKEYTLAAQTQGSLDRGGREHVLLDVDKEFRAGYEAARQQAPEKALNVREPFARPEGYTVPGPKPSAEAQKVVNSIDLSSVPAPEKTPTAKPAQETQATPREQLRAALEQRFDVASIGTLLKPADEYRFKGDGPLRIAFTDHGKQISTSLDTKEVVKGMADLAQAKGWREITANGTPEFKRSMWMEGNLRGIHVTGFSPSKEDLERLKTAREQLAQEHKQPQQSQEKVQNTVEAGKSPQPERQAQAQTQDQPSSTREQWMNATKQVLQDQGLDKATLDRAMERMGIKVDAMLAAGHKLPAIMVYDRQAPSLAPTPNVTPQQQPTMQPAHEVAAPGR